MDENIISQISGFLSEWGFWQLIAIALITLLTLVLKIPIKRAAEKYQAKKKIDKSVITWTISLIPFVLAFAAALVLDLWERSWNVNTIEWPSVVKQASVLGGASIGIFEAIKKWAQASTAKKTAKKVAVAAITGETDPKAIEEKIVEINPLAASKKGDSAKGEPTKKIW